MTVCGFMIFPVPGDAGGMRGNKKTLQVSPCRVPWASQGLNLGPPDYESFRVIFHKIPCNINVLIYSI